MKYSIIRVVFEFPPIIGGSVTHITELATKIDPYLNKQLIIAPDFIGGKKFDQNYPIEVIRLPYVKILSFRDFMIPSPILFFYAHIVVKKIKLLLKARYPIDVIHVHGSMLGTFIQLYLNLYRLKIPVIVMQHGYGVQNSIGHRISRRITYFLLTLFSPSYILYLDDGNEFESFIKEINKINIPLEIVYHGIDSNYFAPIEYIEENSYFIILFPHRPDNMKKPELALKIFSQFLSKIPTKNAKLIMLAADDQKNLKDLSKKLNVETNIEFLPKQNIKDVLKYINISNVVIGTSLESNMNRAIQESMACGKPVVVFNSGGTNRLIKHMENGLLINPDDENDFVENLFMLYRTPNLGLKLGINARFTIIKERNWERRIIKELKVYQSVMNGGKS
ncbi:glycosyltransferase family 4 protein [Methanosarcina mazei]|uniref:Glycosyl transferase family 1 domain-containing protein n=1 Tax=Methanosarcina mazei TaxID=2209 RepID=A0A0F8PZW3_METMZ|nr:glycosyltransferase family 4 protein [Methanosarcina mazei]KKH68193.1 hypothetical protein DU87_06085 [Methanosarcina mazei]